MKRAPWKAAALVLTACAADVTPRSTRPRLPLVHDASGASPEHVDALVRAALDGLGFDPDAPEGPNADDRVFIGPHVLAWIDQTGFYGKMNGLWILNGAPGDALDFVVKDPDGRPVNTFLPGENGEGRFPPGYEGAEHLEFPNRVPEPNDPPSCAESAWCNQYSLAEAVPISNPRIPWWSSCNKDRPSFTTKHEPILVEPLADGGVKLVYEGPLVKEADGDHLYDGDGCHEDYLFPDGVRRRVNVRVGYELHPSAEYIDRTQQLVNLPGNPVLAGDNGLIGGFVMTAFPSPHYLKRWDRFWRPETADIHLEWNGALTLPAATWTNLAARPRRSEDVFFGYANQPVSIAPLDAVLPGRTVTIENVGPSDNADDGVCLCVAHGAIELGGGLIHKGQSLPIAAGQMTIEARRRLTFSSLGSTAHEPGAVVAHTYDWTPPMADDAGFRVSARATDWGAGAVEAVFALASGDDTLGDAPIAVLDVFDVTTQGLLASRTLRGSDFRHPHVRQRFTLEVSLDERAGHTLETRVYWPKAATVTVGRLVANVTEH